MENLFAINERRGVVIQDISSTGIIHVVVCVNQPMNLLFFFYSLVKYVMGHVFDFGSHCNEKFYERFQIIKVYDFL